MLTNDCIHLQGTSWFTRSVQRAFAWDIWFFGRPTATDACFVVPPDLEGPVKLQLAAANGNEITMEVELELPALMLFFNSTVTLGHHSSINIMSHSGFLQFLRDKGIGEYDIHKSSLPFMAISWPLLQTSNTFKKRLQHQFWRLPNQSIASNWIFVNQAAFTVIEPVLFGHVGSCLEILHGSSSVHRTTGAAQSACTLCKGLQSGGFTGFFWSVARIESRKPYQLIRDEVNHGVCISSKPLRLQNMERRFRVRVDEMGSKGGLRVLWPRVQWRMNPRSKDPKGETSANSANRREAWMKFASLPTFSYGFVWFDCFAPIHLGFGCWLCCFEQPGCDAKWSSASKGLLVASSEFGHPGFGFACWHVFLHSGNTPL